MPMSAILCARPLRAAWFAVVYPALILIYLGQGAFLLGGTPHTSGNLLYSLVPQSLLYPMILLAVVVMGPRSHHRR